MLLRSETAENHLGVSHPSDPISDEAGKLHSTGVARLATLCKTVTRCDARAFHHGHRQYARRAPQRNALQHWRYGPRFRYRKAPTFRQELDGQLNALAIASGLRLLAAALPSGRPIGPGRSAP